RLSVAGEGNAIFLAIEDELFSSVLIVRQLDHELKSLALGDHDRLTVDISCAADQNREMDRPLGHATLQPGSNRGACNRIQMLGDEFVSICRWISRQRFADQHDT